MYLCYLAWLHWSLVNQDYLPFFFRCEIQHEFPLQNAHRGWTSERECKMTYFYWTVFYFPIPHFFVLRQPICLTSGFGLPFTLNTFLSWVLVRQQAYSELITTKWRYKWMKFIFMWETESIQIWICADHKQKGILNGSDGLCRCSSFKEFHQLRFWLFK